MMPGHDTGAFNSFNGRISLLEVKLQVKPLLVGGLNCGSNYKILNKLMVRKKCLIPQNKLNKD